MSNLFAFNHAQEMETVETHGRYCEEKQVWIGDGVVKAAGEQPDGLTVKDPTGTITFPFVPDADATFDWE
ncbi:MAG: hypothetical protein M5U34_37425 [Chloroflexi bacterium]|nr:hypothetical protein [Chloroflexota bacterium]